ncbi:3-oxoacyl-[acyl-carrier-protein] synthase III C-terminal domain-containing protein [Streptomyces sp. AK02-01A]|uniref:3-oxoacyl-[acyl-carrier-protein] synthase III C-terminal domain-containing protein n=1 Tax=Streptomyces sp. AK02-01A TaxID=3028648 RepID=UPI0029A4779A|nr:3-oxoacyl-[acyl-carrier-protein] synthase III C-terminal domain-containing protein [Streptomyces sp. AK02-01A]MDX3854829.1 3-oxoacyl-[acyl-carrier-protein] synthase III C-terminal domain-containing protein [Streptomyces sp. AK02-01A]
MTALVEVGCHLPESSVGITEIGAEVAAEDSLMWTFRRFYGLRSVRRAPDDDLRTTLRSAVNSLTALRGNEHRVRYVVYARTVSTVEPAGENTVEDLCAELGLANAIGFTLTQHGCATGVFAMDLAGRLLAADGDATALALVVTGEKVFSRTLQIIPESTVMGEGTAACLVSADGQRDRLLGFATVTRGQYSGEFPPYPLDPMFLKEHNDTLAAVMRDAAEDAGVDFDDLALILPHNVNRLSWQWTCKALGISMDRVYLDNIPVTGHCFTADPFINYVHAREAGRLRPGDLYLMAAVGLGATFSAAVLRH